MKRSLCVAEPAIVRAHQKCLWKFHYTPSFPLPAKTRLRFALMSHGFDEEWEIPKKANQVVLEWSSSSVTGKPFVDEDGFISYDFTLTKEIPAGEMLTIRLGKEESAATRAQMFYQRKRPFFLYIDTKGKGEFKDYDTFSIDVKGSTLHNIRVIVPSIVEKNQRFDVYLRFEDAFGNVTGLAPDDTLIELSYDQLRENLNWKLFVPETGFLTLPNLYFNEPGIYRLRLKNLQSGETYYSPPIHCYLEFPHQVFWGIFRDDPVRRNVEKDTEAALRYYRDDAGLQFFATSSPENGTISGELWKQISSQVAEFNEEERFVAFLGQTYMGENRKEGVRHIIYAKDNRPLVHKKDSKYNQLKKVYKAHIPKDLVSTVILSTLDGYAYDFEEFEPEYERLVEIYSALGSIECSKKEGNDFPVAVPGKKIGEVKEGTVRSALDRNKRFGFTAGGFDRKGDLGTLATDAGPQYSPGMTAVLATEYTRDELFNAIYQRRTFVTTGEKILIDFRIAEMPMGSEISTNVKPGLVYNRHIHGLVAGVDQISRIEIIRGGKVWHEINPKNNFFELAVDDSDLLEKVALQDPNTGNLFTYYYLKVVQKNGHTAWSSPIWVDLETKLEKVLKKVPKKK
ncbi:MAG: hypothetical protein A3F09_03730 [Chlamydiae bacterium RIFCSPHIGHO2_12_FULL_49_11]|nr:MAG: hypothetical protein A3F09_03730 [Chlamydiae bacterium RIFCSPHIGHO2_12_FULL_49_11]